MNRQEIYRYALSSARGQFIKQLVIPTLDLSEALKQGLIIGYYDAKGKYHKAKELIEKAAGETNPLKVIRNGIIISMTIPLPGSGALYLGYKGAGLLGYIPD